MRSELTVLFVLLTACKIAAPMDAPAGGAGGTGMIATGGTGGVGGAGGLGGMFTAGGSGGEGGAGGAGGVAGTTGGAGGMGGSGGAGGMQAGSGGAGGMMAASDAGGADASTQGYAPCPASGEPCKILPLGDSITFGIGFNGGYRVELFRKALADGKSITFTGSESNGPSMVEGEPFPQSHEGHSGWKIDDLKPLIPDPAFGAEPPHIILLMIGTNDVAQNDELDEAPERLGELIDLLAMHAPDALIVVAQIVPLSFGGGGVEAYNAALPAIVEQRVSAGKHVQLVDMFTGFPESELGDGIHPNQAGYARMAGVWYEAITALLN